MPTLCYIHYSSIIRDQGQQFELFHRKTQQGKMNQYRFIESSEVNIVAVDQTRSMKLTIMAFSPVGDKLPASIDPQLSYRSEGRDGGNRKRIRMMLNSSILRPPPSVPTHIKAGHHTILDKELNT